ncbi:hypothetical protein N9Y08_07060 [Paracoccaceae bacterium]|nr:hypothetical protein [Euryarchaeota archaeon]MDB2599089.1 hypothetical protein [Paracoccaceae bacterium]
MSRGFPTAVADALNAGHVVLVTFAKLEFPSGTIYVHNSIGTYNWGGQDWLGTGDFGEISQIEEGADVSPYKITLTLSGLDATVSGAALNEDYYMHPVTVYLGALNADDALIADPTVVWEGSMDQMDVSIGASDGDVIQLTAESELARFDKSSNRKYTHSQQQNDHSGDLLFEFMADIEDAKIRWGDPNSDAVAGAPSVPNIDLIDVNPGLR